MSKKTKSKQPHPGVQTILVISARHLSPATADAFRATYDYGINYYASGGSYVLHIDEESCDSAHVFWPDDLRMLVDFALDQGCSWLALTPSGEKFPNLVQYS